VRVVGASESEREALEHALDVRSDEESTLLHVHGFHSYPARLHPASARGLVAAFSKPYSVVLDPFCGSGTVLVEARALGRKTTGVDANPLAIELAWLKTVAAGEPFVSSIEATARVVAESADARRKAKAGATKRYGEEDDLENRLREYAALLPTRAPLPRLSVGDARRLTGIEPKSIDLVLSSPPYPGVYDYLEQHRARLRWLGLPTRHFETAEIGTRRHARGASYEVALERWQREFGAVLSGLARVLSPKGSALLVLADSVLAGRAVYADTVVTELAGRVGLVVAASAAQERPHFHAPTANAFRKRPRAEHVLVLRKSPP
jgi:SAM-dependent methyltransferase